MAPPQQSASDERKARLVQAQRDRKIRIINSTVGEHRVFKGRVVVSKEMEAKLLTDENHLEDILGLCLEGKAVAYWADGSRSGETPHRETMGAGVAWKEKEGGNWRWKTKMYSLGEGTGEAMDAELFGIAAALRLAVEKTVQDESLEHIRIFSDCLPVLKGLRDGSKTTLGPAVSSPWALQDIYDDTDSLVERGIEVELVWAC